MHVLGLVWGILAMCGMVVGFFPCLGALNWLTIPFAVVGLIISIIAQGKAPAESKGTAKTGVILNAIAAAIGSVRLILGGGVL
jgi:hypothetical protein